jgi:hypothetical protein
MLWPFVTKDQPLSSFIQDFTNDERPKEISQFKTTDGFVCTTASTQALVFAEKANSFID